MQTDIEEFLRRNHPALFLASEVAEATHISRGSALRRLKRLVAKGKAVVREGRCGSAVGPPPWPGGQLEERTRSISDLTGIPRGVIEDWAEGLRAKGEKH